MREVVQATQELEQGRNRLRQVITDHQELERVFQAVALNARETYSELGTGIDTFARLSRSVASAGLDRTNDELLELQKTILQLAATSGRSNIEITQGLRQLFQGIASNRLSGDELRSVLENISPIADVIAESLGVSRGELRALGEQGRLTTRVLVGAFEDAAEAAEERFGRINRTLQQTQAVFQNVAQLFAAELDEAIGVTSTFGSVLETLIGFMQRYVDVRNQVAQEQENLFAGLTDIPRDVFVPPEARSETLQNLHRDVALLRSYERDTSLFDRTREEAAARRLRAEQRIRDISAQADTEELHRVNVARRAYEAQREVVEELVEARNAATARTGVGFGGAANLRIFSTPTATLAEIRREGDILATLSRDYAQAITDANRLLPEPGGFGEFPLGDLLTDTQKALLEGTIDDVEELTTKIADLYQILSLGRRGELIDEEGRNRFTPDVEAGILEQIRELEDRNRESQKTFDIEQAILRVRQQSARNTADETDDFEVMVDLIELRRDREILAANAAGVTEDKVNDLREAYDELLQGLRTPLQLRQEALELDFGRQNQELAIQADLVSRRITDEEFLIQQAAIQLGGEQNITEEMRRQIRLLVMRNRELNEAERIRSLQEQVVGGITGSFQEAFNQLLDGNTRDLFRNFFEGVARSFTDAIIQDWSDRLADFLFDFLFPPGGGGLSSLFTPRQQGGPVFPGGGPYLVGERGPEVFLPNVSGYIAPSASGFGSNISVVANTTVNGSVRSEDDIRRINKTQRETIEAAVNKSMQQFKYRRFPNPVGT